MATTRLVIICSIFGLLAGCAEEPQPRSVAEFLENRILLEATMVRCGENRNLNKYEAECVNAREAINLIATDNEAARREKAEAQFERKRKSLRRTQEAAAEAKRRAAEARRRREEAEYLGVPDETRPGAELVQTVPSGHVEYGGNAQPNAGEVGQAPPEEVPPVLAQAPIEEPQPEAEVAQDLEAIREELQNRQDSE